MDQMFSGHYRDNNSHSLQENETRNQEPAINTIFIDTNDKRFKDAVAIAKNIFVKRTRTLYNWLHPNVSRKQINQLVMQTWEKLPQAERRKEILQVLNDKNQQSTAQVNPQVFDLFQEHIMTDGFKNGRSKHHGSIQPKVTDINYITKVEPVVTSRTMVTPITLLPSIPPETQNITVNVPSTSSALKRTQLSDEENGNYFNLENCKKIKTELITEEEFSSSINCEDFVNVDDVLEEFGNDPELNSEFQQFVFNERRLLQL